MSSSVRQLTMSDAKSAASSREMLKAWPPRSPAKLLKSLSKNGPWAVRVRKSSTSRSRPSEKRHTLAILGAQLFDPKMLKCIAIGQKPRRVDEFPMVRPEHGLPGLVGAICCNDGAIADLSDGAAAGMEDGHQQRAREVADLAVLIASARRDDGARPVRRQSE